MKKIIYFSTLATIILTVSTSSIITMASTISGGYAQSNIQSVMNKACGLNLKYNYEQDNNSLGIVSSFTHSERNYFENDAYNKGQYYGITAGPIFHINSLASIYGVIGIGYGKFHQIIDQNKINITTINNSDYGFSYGTGLQFNIIKDIVLDISYERSRIRNISIDTWIAGLGYRF